MALTNDDMLQLELDCHSLESITLQDIPAGQREWLARVIAALRHEMDCRKTKTARINAVATLKNASEWMDLYNASAETLDAWDSLASGRYSPHKVEKWLVDDMAPAIQHMRQAMLTLQATFKQQDQNSESIENIIKNTRPTKDMMKAVSEVLGPYHYEDYELHDYLHDAYIIMESVRLMGLEPFLMHVRGSNKTLRRLIGGRTF